MRKCGSINAFSGDPASAKSANAPEQQAFGSALKGDLRAIPASALVSLDSGQAFRWKRIEGGFWQGVIGDCLFTIGPEGVADASDTPELLRFFAMDTDWEGMRSKLRGIDGYLDSAMDEYPGLRILRQDHFETLISFIISSFNNIARISGIIERFCSAFGRPVTRSYPEGQDAGGFFSFPRPTDLTGLEPKDLECCRMGFRSRYIADAVAKVNAGEVDLDRIGRLPFAEAKKELMRIKGVGDKVASCILLFSYSFYEAFPKDVWIKRALASKLGGKTERDFGACAGVAQQYVFMKIRNEERGSGRAKASPKSGD